MTSPAGQPDETRRYLSDSRVAIGPRDRLQIAGIVRPDIVEDLGFDATVAVLLPHDATLVLERTDPDVVLIQSSAVGPGAPWAYGGEPSAGDVGRRMLGVVEATRSLGRRVVLWYDRPRSETPALIPFESRVDLVVGEDTGPDTGGNELAWSTGVQLARFNPIAAPRDRSGVPVTHRRWDHRGPRRARAFTESAVADLLAGGLEVWIDSDDIDRTRWVPEALRSGVRLVPSGARLADLYRERAVFLAEPLTARSGSGAISISTLRQLASGGRLVSGPNDALRGAFDERIEWAMDPEDVRRAVGTAVERGARSIGDQRSILRDLFREHDTSAAVARLARLTGAARPTTVREVCVVARLDGDIRAEDFVDALTTQDHRPTEALIAGGDAGETQRAVNELEWVGIAARAHPQPPDEAGLLRWAAERATAGWLWAWSPRPDRSNTFLSDALAAGAMTRASAVGRASVPSDRYVDDLAVTEAIVARATAQMLPDPSGGSLAGWSARGASLFGLAAVPGVR